MMQEPFGYEMDASRIRGRVACLVTSKVED